MFHQATGSSLVANVTRHSLVATSARTAVAFVILLFIAGTAWAEINLVGKVISVQDGDTLTVVDEESRQVRIRIAGIDAPEKDQPYGSVSGAHLVELALGRLAAAACPKTDRYGRSVCTVWINDVDVGLAQLRAGFAWHYKRYAPEQSTEQRKAYAEAEEKARAMTLGIWLQSEATAPWDWRRRKTAGTTH